MNNNKTFPRFWLKSRQQQNLVQPSASATFNDNSSTFTEMQKITHLDSRMIIISKCPKQCLEGITLKFEREIVVGVFYFKK